MRFFDIAWRVLAGVLPRATRLFFPFLKLRYA